MDAADVEALSAAARGLSGEFGLSLWRFALDMWTTGHRLHTAEVPSCLGGWRHYVVCPRVRGWNGVATFCDCRGCPFAVSQGYYHRLWAVWRDSGCTSDGRSPSAQAGGRI